MRNPLMEMPHPLARIADFLVGRAKFLTILLKNLQVFQNFLHNIPPNLQDIRKMLHNHVKIRMNHSTIMQDIWAKKLDFHSMLVFAGRKLCDRYLEEMNEHGYTLESAGKYELIGNAPHPLPPT